MAFFRNFGNAMDSDHDLNEKGGDNDAEGDYVSAGNNRQMDLNFVEKDGELKEEDQYQSEGEPSDAGRQQSDASGGNAKQGKRTGPSGTWGSNFWKDCQPMWGSKDEQVDGKKDDEVIAVNSDEDSDWQKDGEQLQRGQIDVPADEMLSDDYYEQDGKEQSDSLHGRGLNLPSIPGSRLPLRPVPVMKNATKSSKAAKYDEYDEDEDYEESVEEEGLILIYVNVLLTCQILVFFLAIFTCISFSFFLANDFHFLLV